ncbi:MAS20-domain-containing protein [Coprinopsis marcescibilis]|uniref:MAS20-domain-containing protein n=1 Tax=Coprinopsis marcescibilis TaxID=230819 RepID=A0A5C3KZ97_COPMA|nr:MAS20-domain-containing protein [Coprinopsis marcescibilis]
MESRTTLLSVAALVATGVVAYAIYFDYKRRNDVDFRRKLKKERKRVHKSVAESKAAEVAAYSVGADVIKEALEAIRNEPPVPLEERENYFMTQVAMGEQLATQGPTFYVPASIAFFRALRIYPAPAELIGIYEKTVPEPIFKMVIDMTNLDVTSLVEGYFDVFPPKSMNISIKQQEVPSMKSARHTIVVNRDFAAGEVIYKEHPIVAALDPDLQAAGSHCTHCFRIIEPGLSITDEDSSTVLPASYCSKSCLLANKTQSHGLLFTLENPLPAELLAGPMPELDLPDRKAAQEKLVEYIRSENRNVPMLAARFMARQIVFETNKLVAAISGPNKAATSTTDNDYSKPDTDGYQLADHIERWRFLEITPPEAELPIFTELLKATLPGLEQFTTPERHAILVGKMAYNSYGVTFNGGRDDRPVPNGRPEDVEKTRTPYGTHRQIGSALYTVSSYLNHSCNPSARVSFSAGTTELHLVANRDVKKGEAVDIAFVDVKQHPDESIADCRRRRRVELVRGWKFACGCERCEKEAEDVAAEAASKIEGSGEAAAAELASEEPAVQDEAKVEVALRNYEEKPAREHQTAENNGDVE